MVCEVGLEHSSGNDCGKFILAKVALAEEKFTFATRDFSEQTMATPQNNNGAALADWRANPPSIDRQ